MFEYTNFIDEELSNEVQLFLNKEEFTDYYEQFNILKNAYDVYLEDYKKFPDMNSTDSLDIIYDEDHKRFYRKYIKFATKCKEMSESFNTSGYGRDDLIKIRIQDLCKNIDYNFPYGWKG